MMHDEEHKKPKGILKNSPKQANARGSSPTPAAPPVAVSVEHPDTKEVTLQNTLQNAGRRHSSQGPTRRQSTISIQSQHDDDNTPHHLRWDEANLYLAEQEKTSKMKINEPKTPFAPQYDPTQDEEEMRLAEANESLLNAQGIVVDELDDKSKKKPGGSEEDIPDFELGEPEEYVVADGGGGGRIFRDRSHSIDSQKGEKHVVVGDGDGGDDGDSRLTPEEYAQKHREFEQRRKKHYEMKNIKELLAHPEQLDELEDEDENEDDEDKSKNAAPAQPPSVPKIPERFLNGKK